MRTSYRLIRVLVFLFLAGVVPGCWMAGPVTGKEDSEPTPDTASDDDSESDTVTDSESDSASESESESDTGIDTETDGTGVSGNQCGPDNPCAPGYTCWNGVCVGEGTLRFSLSWFAETDFDLHVETPTGVHVYYGNPDAGGGTLDVDDCVGNMCAHPGAIHVENIYFAYSQIGTYHYWVENYGCQTPGFYTLEVYRAGVLVAQQGGILPSGTPGNCGKSEAFTLVSSN